MDDNKNESPKKGRPVRRTIAADTVAETVDEAKVAAALAFVTAVRAKASKNKLDEAFAIGDHIYSEFFGRSEAAYTHKGANSPSLRALKEHPELKNLGVSRATIANYITVTIQRDHFETLIVRGMVAPRVRALGYIQRVRLAPCKKVTDKIRIAIQAVDEGLTGPQVQELVSAANAGKAAAARPPESEIARDAKALYRHVAALTKHDLNAASEGDLASLGFFALRSAKALNELAAFSKGELASRPGARVATPMDALGAETPDELDLLMQAVTGENLGLGSAIRRDTTKVIQGLGAEILANLEHADPAAVRDWLATFVAAATAKIEGSPDNGPIKSAPLSRGRRTWYVVFGRAAAVEHEPGSIYDLIDGRLKVNKCIVQAVDEDDAAALFRQRAEGLDADVGDPSREIGAERFHSVGTVRVSVTAYLRRPLLERLPTLDEFIFRALVEQDSSA